MTTSQHRRDSWVKLFARAAALDSEKRESSTLTSSKVLCNNNDDGNGQNLEFALSEETPGDSTDCHKTSQSWIDLPNSY
jgi:hypothetical protein